MIPAPALILHEAGLRPLWGCDRAVQGCAVPVQRSEAAHREATRLDRGPGWPTALIIRTLALLTISRGADGPWEVDLSGVRCPVVPWWGVDDRCALAAHGMRLAEDLPGARLVLR